MTGAPKIEEQESLASNQYQWNQQRMEKEVMNGLASGRMMENSRYNKSTALYDQNVTITSENSNNSEISMVMEKIAKTNQLMAQQQMTQQRALQALCYAKNSQVKPKKSQSEYRHRL